MNKKHIMIGITCILLLITGVCYSCAYTSKNSSDVLIADLSSEDVVPENNRISDASTAKKGSVPTFAPEVITADTAGADLPIEKAMVYIHLCGAVKEPGVYQVEEDTRIIDVIELAGGFTDEAAGDYINQALKVSDGQKIYVPNIKEVEGLSAEAYSIQDTSSPVDNSSSTQLININTADAMKLMELPGVGEAKAASIIEYRTTNGSFQTIEELMKIPGIKEGLFQKVSSLITVK